MTSHFRDISPSQRLAVYPSDAFCVVTGANEGDGISFAGDLVLDDIYKLTPGAQTRMVLAQRIGKPLGWTLRFEQRDELCVHLDCTITLMDHGSKVTEALVLVEVDYKGHAHNVFVLPLAPIHSDTEYHLVGVDRTTPAQKLTQLVCVSFSKGTRITLACGRQRPIEDLKTGDRVLTRDNGVQPIRWIGHSTQRAQGGFAPIRLSSGAMNNTRDLIVSPDHRLFLYNREAGIGAAHAEQLVKARDLVNGTSVTVLEGGFIEYYQLLFDRHQIVYAEGTATETMGTQEHEPALGGLRHGNGIATNLATYRASLRPWKNTGANAIARLKLRPRG